MITITMVAVIGIAPTTMPDIVLISATPPVADTLRPANVRGWSRRRAWEPFVFA
jgi:hypothetical protein